MDRKIGLHRRQLSSSRWSSPGRLTSARLHAPPSSLVSVAGPRDEAGVGVQSSADGGSGEDHRSVLRPVVMAEVGLWWVEDCGGSGRTDGSSVVRRRWCRTAEAPLRFQPSSISFSVGSGVDHCSDLRPVVMAEVGQWWVAVAASVGWGRGCSLGIFMVRGLNGTRLNNLSSETLQKLSNFNTPKLPKFRSKAPRKTQCLSRLLP
ncbi:30S ribosomal protein S3 [Striga asiatica]|uniref:30S ribosomal protein S3 n=1 Tax=Striga asiatica TaxID=4170 RepID=A0A5A7PZM0_STRAF|nr:30S ribosomal protein S3 [Striga asiatica]